MVEVDLGSLADRLLAVAIVRRRESNCCALWYGVEQIPPVGIRGGCLFGVVRARSTATFAAAMPAEVSASANLPRKTLGRSATCQSGDPRRESVVVIASYPGAWTVTVELSFGSSILTVPSGPVFTRAFVRCERRSRNLLSGVTIGNTDGDFGLADNLGRRKVNSASTSGTAKSKMLTGHETWLHCRLLFNGVVR